MDVEGGLANHQNRLIALLEPEIGAAEFAATDFEDVATGAAGEALHPLLVAAEIMRPSQQLLDDAEAGLGVIEPVVAAALEEFLCRLGNPPTPDRSHAEALPSADKR